MKNELKEALWREYLKVLEIPELQKKNLKELGPYLLERVPFMYEIYQSFGNGEKSIEDKKTGIVFEAEDELYILRKGKTGIFLRREQMKSFLSDMISLFEEILPIGSVVELKKEKLCEYVDTSKIEQFRVIITKRFVGVGTGCYYPYAAVVYPIGTAGEGKMISFTPVLIDNIVFTGYSDDVEEAFVFQMKYQLIIKQRKKSVGFATKQEMEEFKKAVYKLEAQHG